jgi:hypothetical protein
MALETSGTLSIGGTTTNRSINLELGRSATATSSLGETDLRDLAGVASGAIGIDDFYGASSVYEIDNSLKLEPDNSEFLSITNTSAGSRRTATYSFWLKRTELDASSYMQVAGLSTTSETVRFMFYQDRIMLENGNGGTRKRLITNAVYRDTSAFYHFVVAIDTTQSTAANRVKLYVNGVQETSFSTEEYPDQNFDLSIGQYGANFPWRYGAYDSTYYKIAGYLAEAHYIDGTQYAASDFGEFDEDSGIWKPKKFTGNYGTQGSYLNFSDASNLGANPKGSDIDAVLNNIAAADQAIDTPTNNFALISQAMQTETQDTYSVISDGGSKVRCTGFDTWVTTVGTIGVTTGKWYAEIQVVGARNNNMFGIASMEQLDVGHSHLGQNGGNWGIGFYQPNGNLYKVQNSGYSVISGWGSSVSQLQVVGIAVDMDNHNLYIAINNTYQNSGVPTSGATGTGAISFDDTETVAIATTGYSLGSGNDTIVNYNFGGYKSGGMYSQATDENGYGAFRYAPPSGYYALCTKNLAEYG